MITTLIPEEPSGGPTVKERRKAAGKRRIVVLLVGGAIAAGAMVAGNVDGTASLKAPSTRNEIQPIPAQEMFPGCLNDIECFGEPSHLPPGYWDRPE